MTVNKVSPASERMNLLLSAKNHHHQFLQLVEQYNLLRNEDKEYLKAEIQSVSSPGRMPSFQSRTSKIQRYKYTKSIQSKVLELHDQLEAFRSQRKMGQSQKNTADSSLDDLDEEELERDWSLNLVQSLVLKSIEELISIENEMPMLKKMMEMNQKESGSAEGDSQPHEDGGRERTRNIETYQERLDGPPSLWFNGGVQGPLLSKQGKPLRPFVLLDSQARRQELQQNVFRPSHNLPTMTIDEYLRAEKEMGNIIERGGKPAEPKEDPDDQDEGAIDAATYKARQWDAFKDDNPRGSGNRMNKG